VIFNTITLILPIALLPTINHLTNMRKWRKSGIDPFGRYGQPEVGVIWDRLVSRLPISPGVESLCFSPVGVHRDICERIVGDYIHVSKGALRFSSSVIERMLRYNQPLDCASLIIIIWRRQGLHNCNGLSTATSPGLSVAYD
jgi:hypothetical protein